MRPIVSFALVAMVSCTTYESTIVVIAGEAGAGDGPDLAGDARDAASTTVDAVSEQVAFDGGVQDVWQGLGDGPPYVHCLTGEGVFSCPTTGGVTVFYHLPIGYQACGAAGPVVTCPPGDPCQVELLADAGLLEGSCIDRD